MAQVFDEGEVRHWLLDGAAKGTGSTERVVWTYVVEVEESELDPAMTAGGEEGSKEKDKEKQPKNKPKKRITDFFSFYALESTVIGNDKHDTIRAAYLFYYATEAAFSSQPKSAQESASQSQPEPTPEQTSNDAALPSISTSTSTPTTTTTTTTTPPTLQPRLNTLIHSALTLAKSAQFDVLNALSLLDNPLFLTEQRFGPGDGRLHYYLYNWRTGRLGGGVDGEMRLITGRVGGGGEEGGGEQDGKGGEGGDGQRMGDVGVVML